MIDASVPEATMQQCVLYFRRAHGIMAPTPLVKRLKYLGTRAAIGLFVRGAVMTFGSIGLLVEPAAYFYSEYLEPHRATIFRVSAVLAVIIGIIRALPRRSHVRQFQKRNFTLELKVGDLLEELDSGRSNIVVPINNRLAPHSNRELGQSIRSAIAHRYFDGHWGALDRRLLDQLRHVAASASDASGVYEVPVGSVAVVDVQPRKIFFLVNQLAPQGRLQNVSKEDFWVCLSRLWEAMHDAGNNYSLSVPILGSGSGRVAADRVSLMQLIFLSFLMASRNAAVTRKLTIVVREDDFHPTEMHEMTMFMNSLVL